MEIIMKNTVVGVVRTDASDHQHDQLIDLLDQLVAMMFIRLSREKVRVQTRVILAEIQIVALIEKGDVVPIIDDTAALFQSSTKPISRLEQRKQSKGLPVHHVFTELFQIVLLDNDPDFFQFQPFVDTEDQRRMRGDLFSGFHCCGWRQ